MAVLMPDFAVKREFLIDLNSSYKITLTSGHLINSLLQFLSFSFFHIGEIDNLLLLSECLSEFILWGHSVLILIYVGVYFSRWIIVRCFWSGNLMLTVLVKYFLLASFVTFVSFSSYVGSSIRTDISSFCCLEVVLMSEKSSLFFIVFVSILFSGLVCTLDNLFLLPSGLPLSLLCNSRFNSWSLERSVLNNALDIAFSSICLVAKTHWCMSLFLLIRKFDQPYLPYCKHNDLQRLEDY